jgi:hypothetical protein
MIGMPHKDLPAVLDSTLEELYRVGQEGSCIVAGAVLIEALRRKGIPDAFPLTVVVQIWNPLLADRVKATGFLPTDEKVIDQWDAEGCKWIVLGRVRQPRPNVWPGHLVVIVPNQVGGRPSLCDLTLPQASKPEWGVELEPLLSDEVSTEFVRGLETTKYKVNGNLLTYQAFPENRSFESTNPWKYTEFRDSIVDAVIARL